MRWKRKTSMWPAAAALMALLILTLIAPRAWMRSDARSSIPRTLTAETPPPSKPPLKNGSPQTTCVVEPTSESAVETAQDSMLPPLPPLEVEEPAAVARFVRPGAEHVPPNPELIAPIAAPIVAGDDYAEDYVVVDQPLPVLPAIEPDPLLQLSWPTLDAPSTDSTSRDSLSPATSSQPNLAVEPPPAIDPETFARAQEVLEQFFTQARNAARKIDFSSLQAAAEEETARQPEKTEGDQTVEQEPAKKVAEVSPNAPRVRVAGPLDRLAMAPQRSILRWSARQDTPLLAEVNNLRVGDRPLVELPASGEPAPLPVATKLPVAAPPKPALLEHPSGLISQLLTLRKYEPAKRWADAALDQVSKLGSEPAGSIAVASCMELGRLAKQGAALADSSTDPEVKTQWVRTMLSLQRRLPVWRALVDPAQQSAPELPSRDASDVTAALQEIASLTADAEPGDAWRQYLLLDQLADLATEGPDGNAAELRRTAGKVLARMTDAQLTAGQRAFLRSPPLAALRRSLEPWAAGPVRLDILAAVQERYESTGSMRYAKAIAQHSLRLQWSGTPLHLALAEHLDQVYRQPNLRLAVTGDFMNRLVPEPQPMTAPVRDRVGGADIRGRSHTTTDLSVQLLPDAESWRIALAAKGNVRSRTYSDTWPARVKNAGRLQFDAAKEIVLTPEGLASKPTSAKVQGRNRMVGVDSEFDPIPLLGTLVRNIARQKHDRNRAAALSQVKSKVARAAKSRLDEATGEKLDDLEANFRAKVLAPLEQLALDADPVDMYTTEKRAVMRLRVAGEQQLGAHTPRPSAPSDSLMSMQTHESSINNAMEGLGLDGRRMAATDLYEVLSKKLTGAAVELPEGLSKRTRIEFAKHDAVRIAYQDDRLELLLSIAELARGRDRIRDFQVHAFYEPVIDGLKIDLVRHGTLQFSGPRLRTGPRVALHSVFGKLLHKAHAITILNEQVENDPRLDGLMVTQLVIDDGWLAVALGPAHPSRLAWRTRVPRLR